MLAKILWLQFVVIILFIIFEFSLKSRITNEAKRIYFEKMDPFDFSSNPFFKNSIVQDSQQYYFDNAGIFLRLLHPGLALFSFIDSMLMFSALVSAVLSLIFSNYIQFVLFAVVFIFMMFISPMPTWYPFFGSEDINFERSLHNHHTNGIAQLNLFSYEFAYRQYNEMIEEYLQGNSSSQKTTITTNDSYEEEHTTPVQDKVALSKCEESTEKNYKTYYAESPEIKNKGTISEALKDLNIKSYELSMNEIPFIGLYHAIMKNRDRNYRCNSFERLFFYFICNEAKKPNETRLTNFLNSNRHFEFKRYNESKDDKYYEDDTDFYDDDDYFPKKEYDVAKLSNEEYDYLFGDGRYDALMDRVILRDWLLKFIEVRKDIMDIKINDIQSNIQHTTEKLDSLKKMQNDAYQSIFIAKEKQKSMYDDENVLISMNYSSAEKFQPEINKLEFKYTVLTNIYEILHKNQLV